MKIKIEKVEEKITDDKYWDGSDVFAGRMSDKNAKYRKNFSYTITDTEDRTFLDPHNGKPILGLWKGKVLCINALKRMGDNPVYDFDLKYRHNRPEIMSPQKFAIEVKKDIKRCQDSIDWNKKEMERLEGLFNH